MRNLTEISRRFCNLFGIITPGQDRELWNAEMAAALNLVEHLSAGGTLGLEGEIEAKEALRADPQLKSIVEITDESSQAGSQSQTL